MLGGILGEQDVLLANSSNVKIGDDRKPVVTGEVSKKAEAWLEETEEEFKCMKEPIHSHKIELEKQKNEDKKTRELQEEEDKKKRDAKKREEEEEWRWKCSQWRKKEEAERRLRTDELLARRSSRSSRDRHGYSSDR